MHCRGRDWAYPWWADRRQVRGILANRLHFAINTPANASGARTRRCGEQRSKNEDIAHFFPHDVPWNCAHALRSQLQVNCTARHSPLIRRYCLSLSAYQAWRRCKGSCGIVRLRRRHVVPATCHRGQMDWRRRTPAKTRPTRWKVS